MEIERFENIKAWQLDRELTRKVYGLTMKPEFARDFGERKVTLNAEPVNA